METKYFKTFSTRQSTEEIFDRYMKVLHKMGRDKSSSNDHTKECEEVPIGEHCMLIRCPLVDHH